MTTKPSDADWTATHEPLTAAERHEASLATDPGCYLRDSDADPAQPFASLIAATCEPPTNPEATVRDAAGACLALCTPSRSAWMFTMLGAKRIQQDATREFASVVSDSLRGAA